MEGVDRLGLPSNSSLKLFAPHVSFFFFFSSETILFIECIFHFLIAAPFPPYLSFCLLSFPVLPLLSKVMVNFIKENYVYASIYFF